MLLCKGLLGSSGGRGPSPCPGRPPYKVSTHGFGASAWDISGSFLRYHHPFPFLEDSVPSRCVWDTQSVQVTCWAVGAPRWQRLGGRRRAEVQCGVLLHVSHSPKKHWLVRMEDKEKQGVRVEKDATLLPADVANGCFLSSHPQTSTPMGRAFSGTTRRGCWSPLTRSGTPGSFSVEPPLTRSSSSPISSLSTSQVGWYPAPFALLR